MSGVGITLLVIVAVIGALAILLLFKDDALGKRLARPYVMVDPARLGELQQLIMGENLVQGRSSVLGPMKNGRAM